MYVVYLLVYLLAVGNAFPQIPIYSVIFSAPFNTPLKKIHNVLSKQYSCTLFTHLNFTFKKDNFVKMYFCVTEILQIDLKIIPLYDL